jgi:chemotaxis protein CheD
MSDIIRVGIADMSVCRAPDKITTVGLGSCVGIVIYSMSSNISGMIHIMLPDSTKIKQNQNRLKFADTGIEDLVALLEREGMRRYEMVAKIAGGAKMFEMPKTSPMGSIGEKNVEAVRAKLAELKIKIKSEDVGLNYGRTILFDPKTKQLFVIKAGRQTTVI